MGLIMYFPTISAPNPRKAALRISTVKVVLDYFLNNRAKVTILSLEAILIF